MGGLGWSLGKARGPWDGRRVLRRLRPWWWWPCRWWWWCWVGGSGGQDEEEASFWGGYSERGGGGVCTRFPLVSLLPLPAPTSISCLGCPTGFAPTCSRALRALPGRATGPPCGPARHASLTPFTPPVPQLLCIPATLSIHALTHARPSPHTSQVHHTQPAFFAPAPPSRLHIDGHGIRGPRPRLQPHHARPAAPVGAGSPGANQRPRQLWVDTSC